MTVVALLGTSGSGKSHVVRRVMDTYPAVMREAVRIPDRRQPILYRLRADESTDVYAPAPLAVLGHYESDCGGADTIDSMDEIFRLADGEAGLGSNVLFEGVLLYSCVNRFVEFRVDNPDERLVVVGLTEVPLDTCEASVLARRAGKAARTGKEPKPVGPNLRKNLTAKWKGTVAAMNRLEAQGVAVARVDREGAYRRICDELGVL